MRIIGLYLAKPDSDMTVMAQLRDGLMRAFRVDLPPEQPSRTATEVEMRLAEYNRQLLAMHVAKASRRRRASRGWRKHVRRMKSEAKT